MPRLPGAQELGPTPSGRSGRPIATIDTSAFGRGVAQLGQGIRGLGASLEGIEREKKAEVSQATRFETNRRFLEFTSAQEDALSQAGQSAQPGAFGFRENYAKSYQDAAKKFFATIPDELKPEYDGKLFQTEDSLAGKALNFEREARKGYYTNTVNDGLLKIENKLYANPKSFDQNLAEGNAFIDSIPDEDVSPIAKEEMRRAWKEKAQFAALNGMPPQERLAAVGAVKVDAGLPDAIKAAAGELGISPDDLATAISYETGGTFDPWKAGPTTKWGQHRGLIQWGEPQRQKYGVTEGMPVGAQMQAVVRYLRDAGVKPGMGLIDVYSAINAGHVGLYDRSDHKAGGAPGTVADKVMYQMDGHKKKAAALLDGTYQPEADPRFAGMSWQDREKVAKDAAAEQQKADAEARVSSMFTIEQAMTNAPAAIQNQGVYTGEMPTQQQFVSAYGDKALQKFREFQTILETSQEAFRMQAMPEADVRKLVEDAKPTSTGNEAGLQQERYETLSKAAEATLKARESDPASYVQRVFPNVSQAFEQAAETGNYQPALAAMATAQQQLGIKDVQLLPDSVADNAVDGFKNANSPAEARIAAAAGLIMSTPDPTQRQALFDQLVKAGLPEMTAGAMRALERGDSGAAKRLFEAAMIDPSDLPGKAPEDATPAKIDAEIQSQIMDDDQVGDIFYGLSDGGADNAVYAARDSKLLHRAVELRVRRGEKLTAAVEGAGKDLFGDVQVVLGDSGVNAKLLLPADVEKPGAVLSGLENLLPKVRQALDAMPIPEGPAGQSAVRDAVRSNRIDDIMSNGYFVNEGDGFAFIDAYTGKPVSGADGSPLVFSPEDVEAVAPKVEGEPSPFSRRMIKDSTQMQRIFQ